MGKTFIPSITPQLSQIVLPSVTSIVSLQTNAFVIKVVDGDTITVESDGVREVIRLIGINTPESVDPRRPVECFGKEASSYAASLLSQRRVLLVADTSQANRDRYNRLLRYVYLDNGVFVNQRLIEEGYAYEYTYGSPYRFQTIFKAAETEAKQQQKGLWNSSICAVSSNDRSSGIGLGITDKDCSDFSSQAQAQDFFIQESGPQKDPHKLDLDKDGVVCESL